jgi:hypothetical protein
MCLLSPFDQSEQGGSECVQEKNHPAHVYVVEISSLCLSALDFPPNYLKIGWTEWAQNCFGTSRQKIMLQNILFGAATP